MCKPYHYSRSLCHQLSYSQLVAHGCLGYFLFEEAQSFFVAGLEALFSDCRRSYLLYFELLAVFLSHLCIRPRTLENGTFKVGNYEAIGSGAIKMASSCADAGIRRALCGPTSQPYAKRKIIKMVNTNNIVAYCDKSFLANLI